MKETHVILPAVPSDAAGIFAIDDVATTCADRREFILRSIDGGTCFVAGSGDRIKGYAVLEHSFFNYGLVSMLYVAAPCRRQCVATALMRRLERECRTPKLFCGTNESNLPMRRLLETLGYRPSGFIENLDQGDPELVFVRHLRGTDA